MGVPWLGAVRGPERKRRRLGVVYPAVRRRPSGALIYLSGRTPRRQAYATRRGTALGAGSQRLRQGVMEAGTGTGWAIGFLQPGRRASLGAHSSYYPPGGTSHPNPGAGRRGLSKLNESGWGHVGAPAVVRCSDTCPTQLGGPVGRYLRWESPPPPPVPAPMYQPLAPVSRFPIKKSGSNCLETSIRQQWGEQTESQSLG